MPASLLALLDIGTAHSVKIETATRLYADITRVHSVEDHFLRYPG
jgi:hypothetical protein